MSAISDFPVGTEQTGFCTTLREHANTEAGLVRIQIGPQDLKRMCDALGALLDDDAAYYGQEARFGFDSHADAIRTVSRARRALEELRAAIPLATMDQVQLKAAE